MQPVKAFFLDVGGVLLTNGWGRQSRRLAAQRFSLDLNALEERHHLTFDAYEEGKLSLDAYLDRVVFYEPRSFAREEFISFMFEQSKPLTDMIKLVSRLKAQYGLKLVTVNNEGAELNAYRIEQFNLTSFIDVFISSCYTHLRKPDTDLFQLAFNVMQLKPDEVVYIDDRLVFVEVAQSLGMRAICHQTVDETRQQLADLGLNLED